MKDISNAKLALDTADTYLKYALDKFVECQKADGFDELEQIEKAHTQVWSAKLYRMMRR